MIYDFDLLPDRRSSESFKWNRFDADVLPMWVADMDFVSPEPVVRALQERVAQGIFGYAGEVPGLREAIVARMDRLYRWTVLPEEIVFIPGVVTGLNMVGNAFARENQGILSQTPVYMPFLDVARNCSGLCQVMGLSSTADGSYCIDWDAFERAITPETRVFFLCNPHNPVGRVYTRGELERIAEICARHDLLICSDEIHCDLIFSGQAHTPIASLGSEISQRTITLMAPSKTFNIAGLSCSFAIIKDAELRKKFVKANQGLVHGVNLLGLVAARAAYQEGQEWLDQLLVYLEGNRDLLYAFVREQMPGARMTLPEGTYLAWIDFRLAGIEGKLSSFFLEKARVAVSDGEAFGQGGKGFIRLNFGCPRGMLLEALQRMKTALETR
jgi:cystathionine beta-lyase